MADYKQSEGRDCLIVYINFCAEYMGSTGGTFPQNKAGENSFSRLIGVSHDPESLNT